MGLHAIMNSPPRSSRTESEISANNSDNKSKQVSQPAFDLKNTNRQTRKSLTTFNVNIKVTDLPSKLDKSSPMIKMKEAKLKVPQFLNTMQGKKIVSAIRLGEYNSSDSDEIKSVD